MNSATFDAIYDAEISRVGSPTRAYTRSVVAFGVLGAMAAQDRKNSQLSRATYYRYLKTFRRAGIAPIERPADLAQIANDIGETETVRLAYLLWSLQASRARTLARFLDTWGTFIADAQALIEKEPDTTPVDSDAMSTRVA
jgi:hypothetical protein